MSRVKRTSTDKFGEHIDEIINLFRGADKKKLKAATASKDPEKMIEALDVTKKELKALHERGRKLC
ncbi:MAG: hypothetical protein HYT98_02980 [Candidatus Sungbacteria bacterium]|nr:hypothetical protein [Candidatus Sungbacteria bacterium]